MEGAIDLEITPSPPEATRQRSVQRKLCFGIPKSDGENAKGIGEILGGKVAESPKKRRGRPQCKPEISTQGPVIDNVQMESESTKNDDVAQETKVETNENQWVGGGSNQRSQLRERQGSDTPIKDDESALGPSSIEKLKDLWNSQINDEQHWALNSSQHTSSGGQEKHR